MITAEARASASHLVPLPGSDWSVWRSVCVRGAGFPAEALLDLAAPASARAADAWIAAPTAAARAALDQAFASDAARTSAYLRDAVREPRFKEAVLWQNRQAVHTAFGPLVRAPLTRGASDRSRKERLAASYLQRYCAKNDTIGFFGPVCWARIVPEGPPLRLAPGRQLVRHRAVHFEGWAIDALARVLDRLPALRPWIAPRLLPHVRVDATRLIIAGRDPVAIPSAQARLLRACDGQKPARRLVRELADNPSGRTVHERDVFAWLEAFEQMGLVIWSLQPPLERDPERMLRATLEQVGDAGVRGACLAALDTLESRRDAVSRAAGDAESLDRALADLERTFTSLTGASATRSPGQTYAGRTLVYEECRRDATIELGPVLLERLGPPLSLLLESARWCTSEIARRYRSELEAIVRRLTTDTGSAALDLAAVLAEGPDLGRTGEIPAPIAEVQAELRRRWMHILAPAAGASHLRYRSADLLPRVRAAFAAPVACCTWARHVSPDLMIAADGADAVVRGEYVIVLGELHLMNTLLQTALAGEHPDPPELLHALDEDCAAPCVVPVHSRDAFTDRTAFGLRPSRAFWYESSREIAPGPRAGVLRTSDLIVTSDAGGIWVSARDGRLRVEAIEFLGYFLALKWATTFGLLPDAAYLPRISFDQVVVARERWQTAAAACEWAWAAAPVERFAAARRWARERGVPRFVFVKAPVERKPCYVDFDSPVYVDTLAKLVRQSAGPTAPGGPITITEMLPTLEQLWLADAEGRRYTSELRLVAVDPSVPRAAGEHA